MHRRQRPNYGIDAPNVVLTFLLIGVLGLGLSVWLRFLWIPASVFLLQCLVMI
jgi:hypothetical protein